MTTNSLHRILTIVCLAVAAPTIAAACATADAEQAASALVLTVSQGESARPDAEQITLECDPPGGSHPAASEACAALSAADGNFDALAADPGMCTKIYDPVTATVTGTWMGKPVEWQKTYGNRCELDNATGSVFLAHR